MKRSISMLLLFCLPVITIANIGEITEELVLRYGTPNNNQTMVTGRKMVWNSYKGNQVVVLLRRRIEKSISVREIFRSSTGRTMNAEAAGLLLREQVPDGRWQMIRDQTLGRQNNILRSRVVQFKHTSGQFAVYVLREIQLQFRPETSQESFLVFLDATAFDEFLKQGMDALN